MDKKIIINADDFGLCAGVNKAVLKAHTEGVLTSATIMANMPSADAAVEIAKALPALGVGVHLNLYEGKPVSENPSVDCLVDNNGLFAYSPSRLAFLSAARSGIRNAIAIELAAQIQYVIDKGLKPTHLDSHKHVHSFPCIFAIVCRLAERFEIPAIRWTFEPKALAFKPWPAPSEDGAKKARIIRIMAKINRLQNTKFFKNKIFLGIAHTGRIDVDFLQSLSLYDFAGTAELMTHPGYSDGLNPGKTRLVQQRESELLALCDERTKRYFKDEGIKLVHYGQV